MDIVKAMVRWLLIRLYRVEVKGLEHYRRAGVRVLIVANHASYLDGVLLYAFLPDKLTFAINTHIAKAWWVRIGLAFVNFLPVDPGNPLSVKGLIRHLRRDKMAVIFPEGRITVTGSLMKVYQGPGLVRSFRCRRIAVTHRWCAVHAFFPLARRRALAVVSADYPDHIAAAAFCVIRAVEGPCTTQCSGADVSGPHDRNDVRHQ